MSKKINIFTQLSDKGISFFVQFYLPGGKPKLLSNANLSMDEADAAQGTVYELGKDGGGYQLLSLHTGGLISLPQYRAPIF